MTGPPVNWGDWGDWTPCCLGLPPSYAAPRGLASTQAPGSLPEGWGGGARQGGSQRLGPWASSLAEGCSREMPALPPFRSTLKGCLYSPHPGLLLVKSLQRTFFPWPFSAESYSRHLTDTFTAPWAGSLSFCLFLFINVCGGGRLFIPVFS